mgnify:CR=1 FL=1
MSHRGNTTFGISVMDEARLVSTLDDEQIARLEMALECYLREETGELRLCSRAQWFQVSGPAVRPAMVVRPHTPDRSRVLWARQSGELYDVVVRDEAIRDVGWIVLQHLPKAVAPSGLTGSTVAPATTGQADRVVFAAFVEPDALTRP